MKFKVGKKVYCTLSKRHGKIIDITRKWTSSHPLVIEFDDGDVQFYTNDGSYYYDGEPVITNPIEEKINKLLSI